MRLLKSTVGSGLFVVAAALATGGQAATLSDVVQQTINTNPEILINSNERLSRDEEIRQAKSGYLPTVDLNAGIGYEWSDNASTRAATGGDEELTRQEASLELRQMLFDGFATKSEVERQRARVNSARYKVAESSENTGLRATEVYLELLKQQELLKLAEDNLKAHQRIFDQIERRSQRGVSKGADLEQITGRLSRAESNVIASRNNIIEAEANFRRVVGESVSDLERPQPPADALPASVDEAVNIALENHPTLQSAQWDVDATAAQHEASKHTFYPRFDLEVGRTWNHNIDGVRGDNEDLTAMLRMRWNLFNGNNDVGRREQTAHLINEAKEVRSRAFRQAEEGVRLSWASYESTNAQRAFLKRHVEASNATRRAYTKQFDIGQRTLLDLLDTENEVFESSRAFLIADYTNLFAQYRILAGMGKLAEALGVALPEEALAEVK